MLLAELRHALRVIRLRPGSSATVVLTLALAIGANSTLFTLVNAALLSPLPVQHPDRLVNIYSTDSRGAGYGAVSYPDFEDLAASTVDDAGLLGYSGLMATATGEQASEVVFGEIVTADYFSELGIRAVHGRTFDGSDAGGAQPVVVLGHRFWRRRFGADPAVVGATLSLNGRPYTIVGVAPSAFNGLLSRSLSADLWAPVWMMGHLRTDQRANRDERWMFVKARLRADSSVERIGTVAETVGRRLQASHPGTNAGRTFRVVPSSSVMVHPDGDRAVGAVSAAAMLAAGLVLLVACANLAGVMLARGLARRREFAIRRAIGARVSDLVRQLLVESALLALAGGAGGLLVARWAATGLAAWRPDLPVPLSLVVAVDWRVIVYTAAVTGVAAMGFAIVPALRAARTAPAGSMAAGGPRSRRKFLPLRDALLVPQLAISLMLLSAAALLARSLGEADAVDPGFGLDRVAFVSLNLSMSGYDAARARQFYRELAATLERRAGVTHTAVTARVPLDLYGNRSTEVAIEGGAQPASVVQAGAVSAGYFETMGIPILRGRAFDDRDEIEGSAPVVIVSAAAARRFWGAADPVGRRATVGGATATVVGVARDVKVQTLGEAAQPFIYEPLRDRRTALVRLVARTAGSADAAAAEMRRAVREFDPSVAVFEAGTMRGHVETMLYPFRLAASVGAAFGLLAMALAAIGLYGVLASGVAERARELAIRLALGAPIVALVRSAAVGTLRAVLVGSAIGALLAFGAGQLLSQVLFGISPTDPIALGGTALALLGVIAAASAGPVRRALRLEPMSLLKS
jgi:predicted permease